MAKGKSKPKYTKKHKSFSEMHGSKADMAKRVGGEQLGHEPQIPNLNPSDSPLLNPGGPSSLGIGQAAGPNPSGEEFY